MSTLCAYENYLRDRYVLGNPVHYAAGSSSPKPKSYDREGNEYTWSDEAGDYVRQVGGPGGGRTIRLSEVERTQAEQPQNVSKAVSTVDQSRRAKASEAPKEKIVVENGMTLDQRIESQLREADQKTEQNFSVKTVYPKERKRLHPDELKKFHKNRKSKRFSDRDSRLRALFRLNHPSVSDFTERLKTSLKVEPERFSQEEADNIKKVLFNSRALLQWLEPLLKVHQYPIRAFFATNPDLSAIVPSVDVTDRDIHEWAADVKDGELETRGSKVGSAIKAGKKPLYRDVVADIIGLRGADAVANFFWIFDKWSKTPEAKKLVDVFQNTVNENAPRDPVTKDDNPTPPNEQVDADSGQHGSKKEATPQSRVDYSEFADAYKRYRAEDKKVASLKRKASKIQKAVFAPSSGATPEEIQSARESLAKIRDEISDSEKVKESLSSGLNLFTRKHNVVFIDGGDSFVVNPSQELLQGLKQRKRLQDRFKKARKNAKEAKKVGLKVDVDNFTSIADILEAEIGRVNEPLAQKLPDETDAPYKEHSSSYGADVNIKEAVAKKVFPDVYNASNTEGKQRVQLIQRDLLGRNLGYSPFLDSGGTDLDTLFRALRLGDLHYFDNMDSELFDNTKKFVVTDRFDKKKEFTARSLFEEIQELSGDHDGGFNIFNDATTLNFFNQYRGSKGWPRRFQKMFSRKNKEPELNHDLQFAIAELHSFDDATDDEDLELVYNREYLAPIYALVADLGKNFPHAEASIEEKKNFIRRLQCLYAGASLAQYASKESSLHRESADKLAEAFFKAGSGEVTSKTLNHLLKNAKEQGFPYVGATFDGLKTPAEHPGEDASRKVAKKKWLGASIPGLPHGDLSNTPSGKDFSDKDAAYFIRRDLGEERPQDSATEAYNAPGATEQNEAEDEAPEVSAFIDSYNKYRAETKKIASLERKAAKVKKTVREPSAQTTKEELETRRQELVRIGEKIKEAEAAVVELSKGLNEFSQKNSAVFIDDDTFIIAPSRETVAALRNRKGVADRLKELEKLAKRGKKKANGQSTVPPGLQKQIKNLEDKLNEANDRVLELLKGETVVSARSNGETSRVLSPEPKSIVARETKVSRQKNVETPVAQDAPTATPEPAPQEQPAKPRPERWTPLKSKMNDNDKRVVENTRKRINYGLSELAWRLGNAKEKGDVQRVKQLVATAANHYLEQARRAHRSHGGTEALAAFDEALGGDGLTVGQLRDRVVDKFRKIAQMEANDLFKFAGERLDEFESFAETDREPNANKKIYLNSIRDKNGKWEDLDNKDSEVAVEDGKPTTLFPDEYFVRRMGSERGLADAVRRALKSMTRKGEYRDSFENGAEYAVPKYNIGTSTRMGRFLAHGYKDSLDGMPVSRDDYSEQRYQELLKKFPTDRESRKLSDLFNSNNREVNKLIKENEDEYKQSENKSEVVQRVVDGIRDLLPRRRQNGSVEAPSSENLRSRATGEVLETGRSDRPSNGGDGRNLASVIAEEAKKSDIPKSRVRKELSSSADKGSKKINSSSAGTPEGMSDMERELEEMRKLGYLEVPSTTQGRKRNSVPNTAVKNTNISEPSQISPGNNKTKPTASSDQEPLVSEDQNTSGEQAPVAKNRRGRPRIVRPSSTSQASGNSEKIAREVEKFEVPKEQLQKRIAEALGQTAKPETNANPEVGAKQGHKKRFSPDYINEDVEKAIQVRDADRRKLSLESIEYMMWLAQNVSGKYGATGLKNFMKRIDVTPTGTTSRKLLNELREYLEAVSASRYNAMTINKKTGYQR